MTIFTAQQDARWGDAVFATPNATNIADADKLAGLAELWAQAKFGFANFWHIPQLNWDKSYREFIPKVLATHSTVDYYRVLQSFYAQLEDGHTGVYPPELIEGKISRLPLRTRLIDGHLLVIGSRDPAANLQGLHAGDEIVTINSEPATSWAERNVAPFVSASTSQDRNTRTDEYVPFLAPIGTTFTLGVETSSGKQSTHIFEVTQSTSQHIPLFDLKFLPGNIAYVALNGFDDDTDAKEWDKHWSEISKASSLILDLRENGGGSDSVGVHVMATLIDKTVLGELSRSTRWIATYRAWGNAETPLRFPVSTVEPDPARHFSGPTVLLIGPRTYSAGEDMVIVFTQAHRGKTIGEPTGGSAGQPLMFKLPGGGAARVCTKHDSFADGRSICVVLVIGLFTMSGLAQNFVIPSGSMEKTLLVGDHVLVDRMTFAPPKRWAPFVHYREPERGDVVVFLKPNPETPDLILVKRLIGLPGDRIHLDHGIVSLNGVRQEEPHAASSSPEQ